MRVSLLILIFSMFSALNGAMANQVATEQATLASQNVTHFRHIMFRESPYASYRGIYPISPQQASSAAHYAFTYDQQGRITRIRHQIGGALIRANETFDSFIWFAPQVDIEYQANKEIHTYRDVYGNQTSAHGAVYRAEYELDGAGQRIALAFYDKQGQPVESEWNVHRYDWRIDEQIVVEKRINLAGEQQSIRPVFEFYETQLEYDVDGKLMFMRNLGLNGEPTNNASGAGIDRIIYDQHGNFVRWHVYSKDGDAVEGNRPMVHIGEHLYDAQGNKTGMRGYDRSGNQIGFSWGVYEHVKQYDEFGNQTSHKLYAQDGTLSRHLVLEYTPANNEIARLKSLDANGQLTASPMLGGAAVMDYEYHPDGRIERTFFNADMSEFQPTAAGQ